MSIWSLRDRRRELRVHDEGEGHVRLECDGEVVEARTGGPLDDVTIGLDPIEDVAQTVRIGLGLRRQVRRVELRETPVGEAAQRPLIVSFVPPDGTRARKRHELQEKHPRLYAARHVASSVAGVLIGILGIGALVSAFFSQLLPRIDWSWLPDLPELSPPDWLHYVDPIYWLSRILPDWDWFGWVPDIDLSWMQYVMPVLVALVIAAGEVERRKKRDRREQEADDADR